MMTRCVSRGRTFRRMLLYRHWVWISSTVQFSVQTIQYIGECFNSRGYVNNDDTIGRGRAFGTDTGERLVSSWLYVAHYQKDMDNKRKALLKCTWVFPSNTNEFSFFPENRGVLVVLLLLVYLWPSGCTNLNRRFKFILCWNVRILSISRTTYEWHAR